VKHVFNVLTINVLSFWNSISNMLSNSKLAIPNMTSYRAESAHHFKEHLHSNNAIRPLLLYNYLLNNVK